MTIEEKKLRKHRRCEKRRNRTSYSLDKAKSIQREYGLSFSQAKCQVKYGMFVEYGRERQVCSYLGICDHPCNGDC